MVTFKQISETIDKSNSNEVTIDICEIGEDFGFDAPWINQERLKGYWIGGWQCTDTWVGYIMYFLDDEPVGWSSQVGRKYDTDYEWFGEQSAEKVRKYILSLMREEESPSVNLIDLNVEIGSGYSINYNSQIIHGTNVLYKGKDATIVTRIKHTELGIDQLVEIKYSDGTLETVEVGELEFKFNLKDFQNADSSYNIQSRQANEVDLAVERKAEQKRQELFDEIQSKIDKISLEVESMDYEVAGNVVTVKRLVKKNLDVQNPNYKHFYLIRENEEESDVVIYQEEFDKMKVDKIDDLLMALNKYVEGVQIKGSVQ